MQRTHNWEKKFTAIKLGLRGSGGLGHGYTN